MCAHAGSEREAETLPVIKFDKSSIIDCADGFLIGVRRGGFFGGEGGVAGFVLEREVTRGGIGDRLLIATSVKPECAYGIRQSAKENLFRDICTNICIIIFCTLYSTVLIPSVELFESLTFGEFPALEN